MAKTLGSLAPLGTEFMRDEQMDEWMHEPTKSMQFYTNRFTFLAVFLIEDSEVKTRLLKATPSQVGK